MRLVGYGIQAFGTVETFAAQCFQAMLGPRAPFGQIILEAARHTEVKMRIIDDVAPYALSAENLAVWKSLSNRIRRRIRVRNKLAHWTAGVWPSPLSPPSPGVPTPSAVLEPPALSRDWMALHYPDPSLEPVRPLSKADLEEFVQNCHSLADDLLRLATAIQAQRSAEDVADVGDR